MWVKMSLERVRLLLDVVSLVAGIAWGAAAVGVLHLPWWLFIASTVLGAFFLGWIRWGIRRRITQTRTDDDRSHFDDRSDYRSGS